MSSSSVTTSDGTVTVVQNDDVPTPPALPAIGHTGQGSFTVGVHSDRPLDGASFVAGLLLGALLFFIFPSALRWHARREARGEARAAAIGPRRDGDADRMAADVAALARRTATLETIVTDPAHRTAREIEALR